METHEFQPGVIQPGMEQIIETGDTLEITDEKGQKFAVTAIEGTATMDFIKSFDTWLSMKKAGITGPVIVSQFGDLEHKFNALPLRVFRQLPSFKNIGGKV